MKESIEESPLKHKDDNRLERVLIISEHQARKPFSADEPLFHLCVNSLLNP
jgi:hypothetical protein